MLDPFTFMSGKFTFVNFLITPVHIFGKPAYLAIPLHRQPMRHAVVSKGKSSPLLARGDYMITIQFFKQKNPLINEELVQPRIVNMQTLEFNEWCDHLADGSTVTAADAAAVMKQLETKLPLILAMNAKVTCSPEGLSFRPKVSGSITQSELKKKLQERKAAETDPEKAAKIDVDRALKTSDLTISDCTVSIVVDLPKAWSENFMQKAKLKRAGKTEDGEEESENGSNGSNGSSSSNSSSQGEANGGSSANEGGGSGTNTNPTNGSNTGGGGTENGGGTGTIDTGGNGGNGGNGGSTDPDDGDEG